MCIWQKMWSRPWLVCCQSIWWGPFSPKNIDFASQHVKKFNVSHPSLFPTIRLTNVVIDNLNPFLREADVLNLLITELKCQDAMVIIRPLSLQQLAAICSSIVEERWSCARLSKRKISFPSKKVATHWAWPLSKICSWKWGRGARHCKYRCIRKTIR